MVKTARYIKAMTIKFPQEVVAAIQKRVEKKQKYYPRYAEADLVRTAVVKHLKDKGFLDKGKDYL